MKLIVRIKGGLGNQLYCYAAARRLALVNQCELVIDDVSGFERDFEYKRCYMLDSFNIPSRKATKSEMFFPFHRLRRFINKRFSRFRHFENRDYIEQEFEDFDVRVLQKKIKKNTTIDGLWQSEKYFIDVADDIRNDLRINPPEDGDNIQMFNNIIKSSSVAVHVRWFGGALSDTNATAEYYKEALSIIHEDSNDVHFYVFSDDPERTKELITFPSNNVTFVTHNNSDEKNAIWDFWLMTKCQHFVIANSTFSWWAAWLADSSQTGIVFYPKLREETRNKWRWDYIGQMPTHWKGLFVEI
jgi:hypothetical protein